MLNVLYEGMIWCSETLSDTIVICSSAKKTLNIPSSNLRKSVVKTTSLCMVTNSALVHKLKSLSDNNYISRQL